MIHALDHHAYAIAGSRDAVLPKLLKAIEKNGTRIQGNPDVRIETFELMGIDEARALKEAAERTAVTGGKKIFIVTASGLTKEAQNALLKILEEPPQETHFFFILPTIETLLPTLRSRLEILAGAAKVSGDEVSALAAKFIQDAPPARLKLVQSLIKETEDGDKGKLVDLLDALEHALSKDTKGNAGALSKLLEVKKYSRDRAPSWKLLLEHLALVLPKL